jgi:hypothetical protein
MVVAEIGDLANTRAVGRIVAMAFLESSKEKKENTGAEGSDGWASWGAACCAPK